MKSTNEEHSVKWFFNSGASHNFIFEVAATATTTTTKPFPTKWGQLHGSNYAIMSSSSSSDLTVHLTILHLIYSPCYRIYRSSLYMSKPPKPVFHHLYYRCYPNSLSNMVIFEAMAHLEYLKPAS
uniref:Uncharacterized protein n=1 Tax=Medicago truncatula TaxID=3880 RepID=A2Q4R4_MEDTR|nr:hypothetical protein MtrDRAFT_AC157507g25v2 [Medicago truncatula]